MSWLPKSPSEGNLIKESYFKNCNKKHFIQNWTILFVFQTAEFRIGQRRWRIEAESTEQSDQERRSDSCSKETLSEASEDPTAELAGQRRSAK